jgi:hypothetical protein
MQPPNKLDAFNICITKPLSFAAKASQSNQQAYANESLRNSANKSAHASGKKVCFVGLPTCWQGLIGCCTGCLNALAGCVDRHVLPPPPPRSRAWPGIAGSQLCKLAEYSTCTTSKTWTIQSKHTKLCCLNGLEENNHFKL